MPTTKLLTDIYRSSKKEGMYLYVKRGFAVEKLPESLRTQFGRAELAMSLLLTPEKTLARADVNKVIASIEQQDFYLQMPPVAAEADDYMRQIPNTKLGIT